MEHSRKTCIAVFFGGQSSEHEVSIQSAKNVVAAIDSKKYQIVPVYISKSGRFFECSSEVFSNIAGMDGLDSNIFQNEKKEMSFAMGGKGKCFYVNESGKELTVDFAFPVLHGAFGEDGSVQGLLRMAGIPFAGPGIVGSAVGMDKDVAKRLLKNDGFLVADCVVGRKCDRDKLVFSDIQKKLGIPMFVKPANAGSSVGVSKVETEEEFFKAVDEAFVHDVKILIEEAIVGREIECSVLGNEYPEASVLGEVTPTHDFYSYDAKYLDSNGAILKIPADLPESVSDNVRKQAVDVFKCLECFGMTRVDFFVTQDFKVYVNEVNTIPGFTSISMYPKLWEVSGVGYGELIGRIIELGMEKHEKL